MTFWLHHQPKICFQKIECALIAQISLLGIGVLWLKQKWLLQNTFSSLFKDFWVEFRDVGMLRVKKLLIYYCSSISLKHTVLQLCAFGSTESLQSSQVTAY